MIAAEPAALRRMNPATQLEVQPLTDHRILLRVYLSGGRKSPGSFFSGADNERMRINVVLRPALHDGGVFARREMDRLTVGPVDLLVKEEVGSQPPRGVRIDAAELVANGQCGHRRSPVEVLDPERDLHGRDAGEQDRYRIAEAQVLRSLSHMKAEQRLTSPDIAAVELNDAVLQFESRQAGLERLLVEHLRVEEPVRHVSRLHELLIGHRLLARVLRAALIDRQQVGTFGHERRGDTRLVVDLHEKRAPALLNQLALGRAFDQRDATLGIDAHADEAQFVEHLLHGLGAVGIALSFQRGLQHLALVRAEW